MGREKEKKRKSSNPRQKRLWRMLKTLPETHRNKHQENRETYRWTRRRENWTRHQQTNRRNGQVVPPQLDGGTEPSTRQSQCLFWRERPLVSRWICTCKHTLYALYDVYSCHILWVDYRSNQHLLTFTFLYMNSPTYSACIGWGIWPKKKRISWAISNLNHHPQSTLQCFFSI